MDDRRGIRHWFLAAAVCCGSALAFSTEILSLFGALRRPWVAVFWTGVVAISLRRRPKYRNPQWDTVVVLCCIATGAIVGMTGVTAAFSPPNSSDAMAYHLPRVIYWAEQSNVRFFPTQYLNQIMLQPLAEYGMLHLYLLAGSDRLINFVQWFAALGSIVGVSAVARELGSNARGQAIAALFCATLPAGILAASGAKNDWVLALWMIAAVYFAIRFNSGGRLRDAILLGMAVGCAVLTKATAYLFLPPLLIAIFLAIRATPFVARLRGAWIALVFAVAINTPQYFRNYQLSGSIMGFDSAQGNGFFRWRNETFGWKQTSSNLLRNLSEQLGARSERWNQEIYQVVVSVHRRLGIDINDPATTWRWAEYHAPRNANHEADAPNRWHLLVLVALSCIGLWRAAGRGEWPRAMYAVGIFCGLLVFCFYLKWQPFTARLFLPLFVVGAPLAGLMGDPRFGSARVMALSQVLFYALFLSGARLPALQNWVRPLEGSRSVLHIPRQKQYFADLQAWQNQSSYERSAAVVSASGCRMVGIDITNLQIEYPLMVLLRAAAPETLFLHTGVENSSARYRQPAQGSPCAVVCLDCGDSATHYRDFRRAIPMDKFVVYLK